MLNNSQIDWVHATTVNLGDAHCPEGEECGGGHRHGGGQEEGGEGDQVIRAHLGANLALLKPVQSNLIQLKCNT